MISTFCKAAQVFSDSRYEKAAVRATQDLLKLFSEEGRLVHTRSGSKSIPGFLDDYAYFISALLDLYETTFNIEWLKSALRFTDEGIKRFYDEVQGGFYTTSEEDTKVPSRSKQPLDTSLPSGDGIMLENLLRLAEYTLNTTYRNKVETTLRLYNSQISQYPLSSASFLSTLHRFLSSPVSFVISGKMEWSSTKTMLQTIRQANVENACVAIVEPTVNETYRDFPLLHGKTNPDDTAVVYICESMKCREAIKSISVLKDFLKERVRSNTYT